VDIKKDFKEAESEQLKYGNIVHKIMEQRLAHGTVLPPVHQPKLEPWVQWFLAGAGNYIIEQQLAIDNQLQACEYFAGVAWFRARIDAMKVNGPACIIVDWKTGKPKDDSAQLMLNAAAVFSHYPEIRVIKSFFVWLESNSTSDITMKREQLPELWSWLWPRIEALREAYEAEVYNPTPSYICANYCPVTACPHHGKAN
jgi:hypothetical protein